MGTANTRMRNPDRKDATKHAVAIPASGISGIFGFVSERDRELLDRERIRRELVQEQFDIYPADTSTAKRGFTEKVARLLRLS